MDLKKRIKQSVGELFFDRDHSGSDCIERKVFLINFLVALCAIGPFIIFGKGSFVLAHDYAAETIPFGMLINQAIKSGSILWNYNIDIGSNFIESLFGFCSSPSVLLQFLFPAKVYPFLIGWIIILYFALAGMTSAMYFKRFLRSEGGIILASLLYSFSGFQCSSMVFQFQDNTVLFPLMLLGIEIAITENKYSFFAIACAINAVVSITGFEGKVLFVVIYFIVRSVVPSLIEHSIQSIIAQIKSMFFCLLCGWIALLTSAIISIPTIVNLLGNPRASDSLLPVNWLYFNTSSLLLFIKSFLLPAEPMHHCITGSSTDWMTNAAYLPLFGFVFVFAFLKNKEKSWLKSVLIICMLASLVQIFNNAFFGFTAAPYRRWYYMYILLAALCTAIVFEEPDKYDLRFGRDISLALIFLYIFIVVQPNYDGNGHNLIHNEVAFVIYILIALGSVFLCVAFTLHGKNRTNIRNKFILLVSTALCSIGLMWIIIFQYQYYPDNNGRDFHSYGRSYGESVTAYLTEMPSQLEKDIGPYRYWIDEGIDYTYYNLGMTSSLPTTNSFISTLSNSIFDFYDAIGVGRHTMTKRGQAGIGELLGEKYIVSESTYDLPIVRTIDNSNGQVFYVYENPCAVPIGSGYSSYMTRSEFNALDYEQKGAAMLATLVVDDDTVDSVSTSLKHYDPAEDGVIDCAYIQEYARERIDAAGHDFYKKNNEFGFQIDAQADEYVFVSMPYEHWWNATVNGKAESIIKVNGLMAVSVPKGNSSIVFTYDYVPIYPAIAMSILGIFMIGGLLIWENVIHKRR